MGLLDFDGEPLSWEETKKYVDHVRDHGITQFLHIYEKLKNRHGDILKWGDEVNGSAFCFWCSYCSIDLIYCWKF